MPRSRSVKPPPEAPPPAFTHAAIANQYARDVVEGRIPNCKWVIRACQRHLDDLARAKNGWDFYFDEGKANHVCRFVEKLPHTKGVWAQRHERIRLQPWQCFVRCVLFGWLNVATRTRRFSLAYIKVPRKNGKSLDAAGIGVYMSCADGEFGAEVYSGATSEKQAWEVFGPARLMVERSPGLKDAFGLTVAAKSLYRTTDGSKFEPVIGKPGDGASPHCGIVDEYHEHADDTLFDTLRTGMGARNQPLLLAVTTAGDNLAGPCKQFEEDCEKVLDGSIERDELFCVMYGIDAEDDWTTEAALRKANPNYGISVSAEFLRTEQKAAISNARKQGVFKTKHLNMWVGSVSAFFNIQKWMALADKSLRPEEFQGLPCVMGIDLSSKRDFTARVLMFKKVIDGKNHYYVFPELYLPEARAHQKDKQHYQKFMADRAMIATPGERIDYARFERETLEEIVRYRIKQVAVDDWNAESLIQAIAKQGRAQVVEMSQQGYQLSDSLKELEALIEDGCIHHDGNQAMTWMMGNLTVKTDDTGRIKPVRQREESKIDGPIGLTMATSRAVHLPSSTGYRYTGLRSIG